MLLLIFLFKCFKKQLTIRRSGSRAQTCLPRDNMRRVHHMPVLFWLNSWSAHYVPSHGKSILHSISILSVFHLLRFEDLGHLCTVWSPCMLPLSLYCGSAGIIDLVILTDFRGTQRRFPPKYIEITLKVIQFTYRSLEIHSKRCYKICTCSVILGELKSFQNYKSLHGFIFLKILGAI